ncbi:unnamed protein product [Chrysoparadoxa australica]
MGSVQMLVMLVRLDMKNNVKLQLKLSRYAHAVQFLTYCEMGRYLPWDYLQGRALLTKEEVALLQETGNKCNVVSMWMLEAIAKWQGTNQSTFLEQQDVLGLKNQVMAIRNASGALKRSRFVETPVLYTHMLWWTLMLFLLIVAFYAGAALPEVDEEDFHDSHVYAQFWLKFGSLAIIAVFLSLFNIALALQEPFGTDPGDISLATILEFSLSQTRSLLALHLDPEESKEQEASSQSMASISGMDGETSRVVIGGASPHVAFLGMPLTVRAADPRPLQDGQEDTRLLKRMMDHSSELAIALARYMH